MSSARPVAARALILHSALEREVHVWREAHERESSTREAVVAAKDRMARELTNLKVCTCLPWH